MRPARPGDGLNYPGRKPGQALDDGGVDHRVFHVRFIRGGIEQPFEYIGSYPVAIPLEDAVSVAKRGRQVAPGAAGSHNPQHRFDKATVIRATEAGVQRLPQAMRLHLVPLGISQHIAIHPKPEAQNLARRKLFLNRPYNTHKHPPDWFREDNVAKRRLVQPMRTPLRDFLK